MKWRLVEVFHWERRRGKIKLCWRKFGSLLFVVLLFVGLFETNSCTSYRLHTVKQLWDMSTYRTFQISFLEQGSLPVGMTVEVYQFLRKTLTELLVQRGLTESASPDLLINIGITVPLGPQLENVHLKGAYPSYIYPRFNVSLR